MNTPIVRLAFRHTESTEHLENHINQQLKKVVDFISKEPTPITIDLVMTPSKNHAHHEVEIVIKSPNFNVIVKKEGPNFYQVLDEVIDTAHRNLLEADRKIGHENKQKRLDKHHEDGEYRKKDRS